jgi:hypothetical protein
VHGNGGGIAAKPINKDTEEERKDKSEAVEKDKQGGSMATTEPRDAPPEEMVVVKDLDTGRAINVQKVGPFTCSYAWACNSHEMAALSSLHSRSFFTELG